jgi:hypothetical protein
MTPEPELAIAAAFLTRIEDLVHAMTTAGVADPIRVLHQALAIGLKELVDVPLLVWTAERADAIAWAAPLYRLSVTFGVAGDIGRALNQAVDVMSLVD